MGVYEGRRVGVRVLVGVIVLVGVGVLVDVGTVVVRTTLVRVGVIVGSSIGFEQPVRMKIKNVTRIDLFSNDFFPRITFNMI